MSVKTWLMGKPAYNEQIPLGYKQNQMGAMDQMLGMGMQGLQNPTAGFEPMQQETMRQFQQGLPSLMSRIGAIGGMGGNAGHSSAYGQAGTQAYGDLMTRLNAQKAQWGQNNISNYMNMINQGMTPQYENMYHPRQQGFGETIGRKFGNNLATNLTTGGVDWLQQLMGGTQQGGMMGTAAKAAGLFGL